MQYKLTKKQKKMLQRIIISAILCVAAFIVTHFLKIEGWPKLLIFLVPYLIIGYDVLKKAGLNIIHGRVFDEMFLMAVATLGAIATGEYPEATAVMLFYQIGELFQSIAVGKSRKSISKLMDIRPDSAVVLRDNAELEVSPDEVEIGETIIIRPGEKIPLDGEIIDGTTTINTAALTGESMPSDATVGDTVISGSLNLTGLIKVKTKSKFSESTVSKILTLVENSSEKKAKVEGFITRFARWYTPCVVIGALLLAVLPPLFIDAGSSAEWIKWIRRALVFLVVSCPCALVVSVPLSFFGGIGGASKDGILIKGANYLEALSKIQVVVFDKTGTLTKGKFIVEDIHPTAVDVDELLDIAAAAESYSSHPVAESIVNAHKGHIDKSRLGEIEEIAGKGVKAEVDGEIYYVGNGSLMESIGADWHECHMTGTIIHISKGTEYLGHIVINDEIKSDSKVAISSLRSLGINRTVMLTGDKKDVAEHVAKTLGVDEFHAELLPAQKVEHVENILSSGMKTAFVGDGINDAPVLMRSDIGIAMGALGSDAAIESADVVLMDDKPSKIADAVRISRKTMRIVWENIIFALGVKGVILILGAVGIANMWLAVFGDVGVLIIAILNSMRCMTRLNKDN